MIKINDILILLNEALKAHYFKDITFYGVADLIAKEGEGEIARPHIYVGNGNYQFIQEDTKGLICYHRIIGLENNEDLEGGFGRNSMTIETYSMKAIFYGQQPAINDSCDDINHYLAKEFKNLFPRRVDFSALRSIAVTGIDYNKKNISDEEGIEVVPESVLFSIDYNIVTKVNCVQPDFCGNYQTAVRTYSIVDTDGNVLYSGILSGNLEQTIQDSTITNSDSTYNSTVKAEGNKILPDITHTDSDGSPTILPAQTPMVCTPESDVVFIKALFGASETTMRSLTIDSDNSGTYTAQTQDGSSGTITININGAGYGAFVNPTVLAIGDTLLIKRTVSTATGFVKLTGS